MDDYEPWLTPCDPDFDPEKCESAYALWAVKEEAVGEQFELGVRPMAISRGVNHRSPHPRVAKSRDSYPLGARLFQRFPSGKRFSIGSRHGSLPVRETPWCRPSGAGSIVGEAPIRHLPPGADLYG